MESRKRDLEEPEGINDRKVSIRLASVRNVR